MTYNYYDDQEQRDYEEEAYNERLMREPCCVTRFELCPQCEGKGTSVAYLGAYTADDFEELGPDFFEDIARGDYDRPCDTCAGQRVVERHQPTCVEDRERRELDAEERAEARYFAAINGERGYY